MQTGICHLTCDAISCTKRAEGQYFLFGPCGSHCGFTQAVFQRTKVIHHRRVKLFFPPLEIEVMIQASFFPSYQSTWASGTTCSWNNQSPPDWQSPTRGRKPHSLLWWLSSGSGKRFQHNSMQPRLISVQFPQGNTLLHESLSPKSPSHLTPSSKRKIKCKVAFCMPDSMKNERKRGNPPDLLAQ